MTFDEFFKATEARINALLDDEPSDSQADRLCILYGYLVDLKKDNSPKYTREKERLVRDVSMYSGKNAGIKALEETYWKMCKRLMEG